MVKVLEPTVHKIITTGWFVGAITIGGSGGGGGGGGGGKWWNNGSTIGKPLVEKRRKKLKRSIGIINGRTYGGILDQMKYHVLAIKLTQR